MILLNQVTENVEKNFKKQQVIALLCHVSYALTYAIIISVRTDLD